jgi:hypothetical protein
VGIAGFRAFGNLYSALETAAMTVIEGTGSATADVLGYKFGEEVRAKVV